MEETILDIVQQEVIPKKPGHKKSSEFSSLQATKPHKCDRCDLSFATVKNLRRHKKTVHENATRFQCSQCNYETFNKSYLKSHALVHTEEKLYKCNFCDKAFKHSSGLVKHNVVHIKEKPYKCDKCEATFGQAGSMKTHKIKFHDWVPTKLECLACAYTTSHQTNLERHLLVHVETDENPFRCNVCDYTCKQPDNMEKHKLVHSNEKPFGSDECEATFTSFTPANSWTNYQLSVDDGVYPTMQEFEIIECEVLPQQTGHENNPEFNVLKTVKSHKCGGCKLNFGSLPDLKRHQQTVHKKVMTYKCSQCNYETSIESHLQKHALVHPEVKLHKCNVCDKEFKHLSRLNIHKRVHTKEKPYKCDNCEATFTQAFSMKKHKLKFHWG